MASRTIVDSVTPVSTPPEDLEALEARLRDIRAAHPGAIVERYLGRIPVLGERVRVAQGAALIGDVRLGDDVSIWYGCVLRGDVNFIEVGSRSNLQDGCVVHLGDRDPTRVHEDVVVGHRAVLHGCTVGAGCLVGINATLLDGVELGHGSIVGAGALVTAGTKIPPHSLVLGMPAKIVRSLDPADEAFHAALAAKYVRLKENYRRG